jgi:hypothetical protein
LPIGCSSWHKNEQHFGHDHVGLTILYYPRDILAVMTIWKWSLTHTTMEGFSLKELLLSYDESYVPKVDVKGMIGVKRKI